MERLDRNILEEGEADRLWGSKLLTRRITIYTEHEKYTGFCTYHGEKSITILGIIGRANYRKFEITFIEIHSSVIPSYTA